MSLYICDRSVLSTKSTLACLTLSWPYGRHASYSTLQKKKLQLTETDTQSAQSRQAYKRTWCILKEVGMFSLKKARRSGGMKGGYYLLRMKPALRNTGHHKKKRVQPWHFRVEKKYSHAHFVVTG